MQALTLRYEREENMFKGTNKSFVLSKYELDIIVNRFKHGIFFNYGFSTKVTWAFL